MFSGIIEELGEVKNISKRINTIFEIKAEKVLADTFISDSISVNGVCLTVIEKETNSLTFEAIPETLRLTNLGNLRTKDLVNLERSLKIGNRLSGHFVTGHIDCIGIIRRKNFANNNLFFEIAVPVAEMRHIVTKGSVALDGISLTVMEKRANTFFVYIIPHTLANTTLNFKRPSDKVNIEFDILTKQR